MPTVSRLTLRLHSGDSSEVREHFKRQLAHRYSVRRMKMLSDGCYAEVYHHPHNAERVVKLATNSPRYEQYITWCAKHQENPWVPRVDTVEGFELQTDGWCRHACIVVMEKLRKAKVASGILAEAMAYLECGTPSNELRARNNFWQLEQIRDYVKSELDVSCMDAHIGNILRRGRIQPVVIDPVVG